MYGTTLKWSRYLFFKYLYQSRKGMCIGLLILSLDFWPVPTVLYFLLLKCYTIPQMTYCQYSQRSQIRPCFFAGFAQLIVKNPLLINWFGWNISHSTLHDWPRSLLVVLFWRKKSIVKIYKKKYWHFNLRFICLVSNDYKTYISNLIHTKRIWNNLHQTSNTTD